MQNKSFNSDNLIHLIKKICESCLEWILLITKTFAKILVYGFTSVLVLYLILWLLYITPHGLLKSFLIALFGMSTGMVILVLVGIFSVKRRNKKLKDLQLLNKKMDDLINPDKMYDKLKIDILQVRVSEKLIELSDSKLMTQIAVLRVRLIDKYGYMMPLVRGLDWIELQPYEYQFFIREKANEKGLVYPDRLMISKQDLDLNQLSVPENTILGTNPIDKTEVYWITHEQVKEYDNIKSIEPCEVIIKHLEDVCIRNADKIITLEYVQKLLEHIENKVYIENLIPSFISMVDLQKILISLINKKISIKDITYILEKLADYARFTKNIEELVKKISSDCL